MSEIEPCQTCGSPVRLRKIRGERSLGDTGVSYETRRVCTSSSCPTNSRETSLADVV